MRRARYVEAVDAFRSAVTIDTGFAIAYYRLAEAGDWAGKGDVVEPAARAAALRSARLTPHDRALVEGFLAWRTGDTDRAEDTYRSLTRDYPTDIEAWYQLGEVRFHSAPLRGRPLSAAREPFERVLALEPGNRDAALHLERILVKLRLYDEFKALTRQQQAARFASPTPALEDPWFSLLVFDPQRARAMATAMDTASDSQLWAVIERAAVFAESLETASLLAQHLVMPSRALGTRTTGVINQSNFAAAQGRFRAADSLLSAPLHLTAEAYAGARAFIAAAPFNRLAAPAPDSIRAALSRWRNETALGLDEQDQRYQGLSAELRPYFEGLLSARTGDVTAILDAARRLESVNVPAELAPLLRSLATELRAAILQTHGDLDGALKMLASVELRTRLDLHPTLLGTQVRLRWLRAELLRALGRDVEAQRIYASIGSVRTMEVAFLAPSHLRQAQILESRQVKDSAAYHYQRFAELWRSSDPELQPMVKDARARAQRLLGRRSETVGSKSADRSSEKSLRR